MSNETIHETDDVFFADKEKAIHDEIEGIGALALGRAPVETDSDPAKMIHEEFPSLSSRPEESIGRRTYEEDVESAAAGYERPEELTGTPESLKARIETATADCEIEPTREVRSALEGYYDDHYELAALLDQAIEGTLSAETIKKVLDHDKDAVPEGALERELQWMHKADINHPAPSVELAKKLLATAAKRELQFSADNAQEHQMVLECAANVLQQTLFQETSLGITTIKQEELEMVGDIYRKLRGEALASGAHEDEQGGFSWNESRSSRQRQDVVSEQELRGRIASKQEAFWDDCRLAGQLEFHNTGYMDRVLVSNELMSRAQQFQKSGEMHTQTQLAAYHDEQSGRRRMHSDVPHFSETFDPTDFYTRGSESGTIVLPLAEIIKAAPFARDARYGEVQPRKAESLAKVPLKTDVMASDGIPNAFSEDVPSPWGQDRVFFASPTEQGGPAADAYRLEFYLHNAVQLYIQERDYKQSWREVADKPWFYAGANLPVPTFINKEDKPEQVIAELQSRMTERYGDRIIVPLRRGVFDFNPENSQHGGSNLRHKPRYNLLPEGAEQAPSSARAA